MPKQESPRDRHRLAPLQLSLEHSSSLKCSEILSTRRDTTSSPEANITCATSPAESSSKEELVLPSRNHQLETHPVKSAMKSPSLSPLPKGKSSSAGVSPPRRSDPPATPKSVRFYSVQSCSPDKYLHTTHYTHSTQNYDRSSIIVDQSLRLPPRAREESDEEQEAEGSLSSSDRKSELNCSSSKSSAAFASSSVLDGF